VLRQTVFADPLRNPQVGLADVVKQFGQVRTDCSVLFEQQLLKHGLVEGDHLLEMRSEEVHETLAPHVLRLR
jgi:hypothetical protein